MLVNTIRSKTIYKLKEQDALQTVISIIPQTLYIRHIKAHQDDNVSHNDLPLDTKLNVDTDNISTIHASISINKCIDLSFSLSTSILNKFIKV